MSGSIFHEAFLDKFRLDDLLFVYHELRDEVLVHSSECFVVVSQILRNQVLDEDDLDDNDKEEDADGGDDEISFTRLNED